MKKLALIFCAAISIYLIACTGQTASMSSGTSSDEQKNLVADSIIGNAFQTGDVSKIDSVVAVDFVDHSDMGDRNRDSLKADIKMMKSSFPDMKMEITDHAAHGDYVYAWMRFTGTSSGTMGLPAGPYELRMIELSKYKDGKSIEHWTLMDMRDVMKFMPQQGNGGMNKMNPDSSKMKSK